MGKPGIRFAGQEMAIIVGTLKVVVISLQIHNTFTSEYNKTVVSNTGIDTYQIRNSAEEGCTWTQKVSKMEDETEEVQKSVGWTFVGSGWTMAFQIRSTNFNTVWLYH